MVAKLIGYSDPGSTFSNWSWWYVTALWWNWFLLQMVYGKFLLWYCDRTRSLDFVIRNKLREMGTDARSQFGWQLTFRQAMSVSFAWMVFALLWLGAPYAVFLSSS